MICPYCTSTKTVKAGKTKAGFQRFYCKDCGKRFGENPVGRKRKHASNADRQKAYRERRKGL